MRRNLCILVQLTADRRRNDALQTRFLRILLHKRHVSSEMQFQKKGASKFCAHRCRSSRVKDVNRACLPACLPAILDFIDLLADSPIPLFERTTCGPQFSGALHGGYLPKENMCHQGIEIIVSGFSFVCHLLFGTLVIGPDLVAFRGRGGHRALFGRQARLELGHGILAL